MIYTFDLSEKVVIITGGYGYLGKAIVESLLYHGARVFVLGRDQKKFAEAFSGLKKEDRSLFFYPCDVSAGDNIKTAFQEIYNAEGKIDVLINNAYYTKGQSPEKLTDEEWLFGIDGTLSNVFRCIREIIPFFKEKGKGKIINVSSMYGIVAPHFEIYESHPASLNPPHYGAAKAGVIQLSRYYAGYLGPDNINVNTVTPGPFPSEQVCENKEFVAELEKKTVLGRIGKPEDLAGAFVFLSSDASNFMTGQNIIVDGGWTSK